MAIEWESPASGLRPKPPPAINVEALAAIAQVRLMAGDVPRGLLRAFYEGVIGMRLVPQDGADVLFRHQRREVLLERERTELGRAAFLVRQFEDSLMRLRDRQISYELLHTDSGLTRTAITRDPAGNWIHLVETRDF
ncbi:MAG TPA: VOC family protein [Phycisphaerae bacterium]|jgi:hypothetical protein|nr:VOC family protein [Phycisphaerae bacterium]